MLAAQLSQDSVDLGMRMVDTARRAVSTWGAHKQLRQLTEECGELIAAVNQAERARITDDQLASEVADVLIMLTQACIILGSDRVDAQVAAKLARLEERLAQHSVRNGVQP